MVRSMGLEPIRPREHYPLKVARLPIPPRPPMQLFSELTELTKNIVEYFGPSVNIFLEKINLRQKLSAHWLRKQF